MFADFYNSDTTRVVKISIEQGRFGTFIPFTPLTRSLSTEQLVFAGSANAVADWAADYDDAVLAAIDEDHPCYLLYRLDSKNAYGEVAPVPCSVMLHCYNCLLRPLRN